MVAKQLFVQSQLWVGYAPFFVFRALTNRKKRRPSPEALGVCILLELFLATATKTEDGTEQNAAGRYTQFAIAQSSLLLSTNSARPVSPLRSNHGFVAALGPRANGRRRGFAADENGGRLQTRFHQTNQAYKISDLQCRGILSRASVR